jgi:hypothetical protein
MRGRECRSSADQCERNEMDKSMRLFYVEGHEGEGIIGIYGKGNRKLRDV